MTQPQITDWPSVPSDTAGPFVAGAGPTAPATDSSAGGVPHPGQMRLSRLQIGRASCRERV